MLKQILNDLEKIQLVYKYNLQDQLKTINGYTFVMGELVPDDKEEAIKCLEQLKQPQ